MSAHKGVELDTAMGGVCCAECGWHLAGLRTDPEAQGRMHDEAYPESPMPDPTTPPPLDDREKVARALAEVGEHRAFTGDPCDAWADEMYLRDADAVLAVLDLPARDRDTARAALTGLADHIDQTASRFVGIRVHSQKAQDVIDYRDATYPTQETPDE